MQQTAKRYGNEILLDPNRLAAVMLPQVFQRPPAACLVDALRDPDQRMRIKTEIEYLIKTSNS